MARVELPAIVKNSQTGLPVSGAAIRFTDRITGSPSNWYTTETGGTPNTGAVFTDANGRALAWVDRGAYILTISGTGLTPTTHYWDATPGGDSTLDSLWLTDGAVTNQKLASGVDAGKFYAGTLLNSVLPAGGISQSQLASLSVPVNAFSAMGKILQILPLNSFSSLGPGGSSATLLAPYQVAHSNKGGFWLLLHSFQGTPSTTGIVYTVTLDGSAISSTNEPIKTPNLGIAARSIVIRAGAYSTLSGVHTWSVGVSTSLGASFSYGAVGDGMLLLFENY